MLINWTKTISGVSNFLTFSLYSKLCILSSVRFSTPKKYSLCHNIIKWHREITYYAIQNLWEIRTASSSERLSSPSSSFAILLSFRIWFFFRPFSSSERTNKTLSLKESLLMSLPVLDELNVSTTTSPDFFLASIALINSYALFLEQNVLHRFYSISNRYTLTSCDENKFHLCLNHQL